MKYLLPILLLTGCATSDTIDTPCTLGEVESYERITRDEKLRVYCKRGNHALRATKAHLRPLRFIP